MVLALVTSAETAPPLATALTTVVDCADEDRRLRLRRSSTALATVGMRKIEERKGARAGRRWDEELEAAADGHEKEL